MSESIRLYRYRAMLGAQRAVPTREFLETLGISLATFKRDIVKLRQEMGVPIAFDRERGGYVLEAGSADPMAGSWFTPHELVTLATLGHLLGQLQPGILSATLSPIRERLAQLLQANGIEDPSAVQRIRLVQPGRPSDRPQVLEVVACGTMQRRRLQVAYLNRSAGDRIRRELSPQRLVLFRTQWYLDAWCHQQGALRSFPVNALDEVRVLDDAADDLQPDEIESLVYPTHGLFAGRPQAWARLRFSPGKAQRVAREEWHPHQESSMRPDGSYELSVPFGDDRDLICEIMRHGPDVEVLAPDTLRARVVSRLQEAVERYAAGGQPPA